MVPLVLLDNRYYQGIIKQLTYQRYHWIVVREPSNKAFANSYWSASPYANNANNAWQVNFFDGNDNASNRTNNKRVRLVRTGAWYGCFI